MSTTADTKLNARLQTLRDRVMARGGSFAETNNPVLRSAALYNAARRGVQASTASASGRSRVQIRAAFLRELVERAPVEIDPDETLAGLHLATQPGCNQSIAACTDDPGPWLARLGLDPSQADAVREVERQWNSGAVGEVGPVYQAVGEIEPGRDAGLGNWGYSETTLVYWARGWVENHSVRDYAKVLRLGYGGIREQIVGLLNASDIAEADFPQKENFWRAALAVCDAGIRLSERYAELAQRLAETETDPQRKQRLQLMAETCRRVPACGARTLHEAAQSLWLAHVLTCGEDQINANSIGRLDQILYPYYKADLAAGRIDRDGAVGLMTELACKLYLEYDVQAIVLGGHTRAGDDAVNDLTWIILDATEAVDFIRDLSVRLHCDSEPAFVKRCVELIVRGGGIPFIFNDDCFIPALVDHGIDLADARDYAPIGCIELTVPGRANPHAVSGWFNSTKCLELALNDGVDPQSAQQVGPRTGRFVDMTDFAQLTDAYQAQVEHFADRLVYFCNRGELQQRERGPLPCWSTLTDDCIARGRDITDGGAVYDYHSICLLGTANTADSLAAIRKLVFREKAVTKEVLLEALAKDYEGFEDIRQMLLKRAPKYGNDHAEVDELAAEIDNHFIDLMDRRRSPLGGRYVVHLFSFLCNLGFGKTTGATPDGRHRGDPLAYSLSAHQGRDERGVTAMLGSLARLPHARAAGASAAIVELDPKMVEGEAGIDRLTQIVIGAIGMGVGQLQWNVVTAQRLQQAKADPERYGNIPVRVAGYSQMFRLVPEPLQDHIIARTKHTR